MIGLTEEVLWLIDIRNVNFYARKTDLYLKMLFWIVNTGQKCHAIDAIEAVNHRETLLFALVLLREKKKKVRKEERRDRRERQSESKRERERARERER